MEVVMEAQPKLCIDASGDQVMVAGDRGLMKRTLDLSLLSYIETDGLIIAQVYDPVDRRRVQEANGAVRRMRLGGAS